MTPDMYLSITKISFDFTYHHRLYNVEITRSRRNNFKVRYHFQRVLGDSPRATSTIAFASDITLDLRGDIDEKLEQALTMLSELYPAYAPAPYKWLDINFYGMSFEAHEEQDTDSPSVDTLHAEIGVRSVIVTTSHDNSSYEYACPTITSLNELVTACTDAIATKYNIDVTLI